MPRSLNMLIVQQKMKLLWKFFCKKYADIRGGNKLHLNTEEEQCWFVVGEVLQIMTGKWAFLVIAELYKESKRFNQLRRALDHVSTKSLTDKGRDFQCVLQEMRKWGVRWGIPDKPNHNVSNEDPAQ
ncbi:helix-turn-helix domain-containing protein [Paenibacillus sp. MSJ-34]|uniref:winged helix-turn-helix transcriptional regulator n=1 Tax=Paenibacillus sp. MSJ-34 TaxID=2841529 RepID=UPI00209E008B|nr:helix-turn-helix domain-containing protein [Paenibacillus sp. MSJ-34]